MAKFEKGVSWYTVGRATIDVNFPEDDIACIHCEYCYSESGLPRCRCRLLREIIYSPYYGRLANCPIKIKEGTECQK